MSEKLKKKIISAVIFLVTCGLIQLAVLGLGRLITGEDFSLYAGLVLLPFCCVIECGIYGFAVDKTAGFFALADIAALVLGAHIIIKGAGVKMLLFLALYALCGIIGVLFGKFAYRMKK